MTNILDSAGFMTKAIHCGEIKDEQFGSLTTPIYQTTTFSFENTDQGIRTFNGEEPRFGYSRSGNPTVRVLEEKGAAIEGAAGCVACGSGMGAIASIIWTLLESGDHIVISDCLYGCSDLLIRQTLPKFNISIDVVDTTDLEAVKAAMKPNTKLVFFETPTNPLMKVTDIAAVKEIAGDAIVVVDNTFAPPPIQRPLECGADIVVHSVTKYLNGHGDVIGGLVMANDEEMITQIRKIGMSKLTGSVCSPNSAYLTIRGLQTLEFRLKRHCESALKLAKYLASRKEVKRVHYPGLDDFESKDIVDKQMNGLGTGIMSFELNSEVNGKNGLDAAKALLDNLELITIAVSLGDPFSLIEHPFTMTHDVIPEDVKMKTGITPELIRFSAGLEEPDDLIADFDQAFAKI